MPVGRSNEYQNVANLRALFVQGADAFDLKDPFWKP